MTDIELLLKLLKPDISLDRAWHEVNAAPLRGRAPQTTVDALLFEMRSGVEALGKPKNLQRLCELSEEQLQDVVAKLISRKPPWKDEEIELMLAVRSQACAEDN
jgi:hypothetical protein